MTSMLTGFSYSVGYKLGQWSLSACGLDTWALTVDRARADRDYYARPEVRAERGEPIAVIHRDCMRCETRGRIVARTFKRKPPTYVRCPECHGDGSLWDSTLPSPCKPVGGA